MNNKPACPVMTTAAGAHIVDIQNTLTARLRGPALLQDPQLIEQLAQQNRGRIPERLVLPKDWGAYGTLPHNIDRHTRDRSFGAVDKKTRTHAHYPGAGLRNTVWRVLGTVCVAIGVINAFLPLLPTTATTQISR